MERPSTQHRLYDSRQALTADSFLAKSFQRDGDPVAADERL